MQNDQVLKTNNVPDETPTSVRAAHKYYQTYLKSAAKYRANNKEKIAQMNSEKYYEIKRTDPEKYAQTLSYKREYYEKNKAVLLEKCKEKYKKMDETEKQKMRATKAKYIISNKETVVEKQKNYYQNVMKLRRLLTNFFKKMQLKYSQFTLNALFQFIKDQLNSESFSAAVHYNGLSDFTIDNISAILSDAEYDHLKRLKKDLVKCKINAEQFEEFAWICVMMTLDHLYHTDDHEEILAQIFEKYGNGNGNETGKDSMLDFGEYYNALKDAVNKDQLVDLIEELSEFK